MGLISSFYVIILAIYLTKLVQSKIVVHRATQNNAEGTLSRGNKNQIEAPSIREIIRSILKSKDGFIKVDEHEEAQLAAAKNNQKVLASHEIPVTNPRGSKCAKIFRLRNDSILLSYFFLFGLLPTFLVLILRISFTPTMSCYGCEIEVVDILIFLAVGIFVMFANYASVYAARNEPDPLGIKVSYFENEIMNSLFLKS